MGASQIVAAFKMCSSLLGFALAVTNGAFSAVVLCHPQAHLRLVVLREPGADGLEDLRVGKLPTVLRMVDAYRWQNEHLPFLAVASLACHLRL